MITRYGIKKILKGSFLLLIICIILGYGIFATHNVLLGPSLVISGPQNGSNFHVPSVSIKGTVYRIKELFLNGRPITIDNKGNFNEVVLLAPGYNVFTLEVRDKFGRSKDYRLEYTYEVN